MKKVLIIGAGFLQDFVICKAKRMGYETYTVDADANAIGFKHADHYKVVNIVDEKACLEYAKENDSFSNKDIVELLQITVGSGNVLLSTMVKKGLLIRVKRGWYSAKV